MRLLLKRIWSQHGQSWDTEIASDDAELFVASSSTVINQQTILDGEPTELELHVFADASLDAMCIVILAC